MAWRPFDNIFITWLKWHFYEAPSFLSHVLVNFFKFSLNLFSLPLLFKTLFYPWKGIYWTYPRAFSPQAYLEAFLGNIFSRLIGAILRITLVMVGIVFQFFIMLISIVIFSAWLLLPFLIISGILFAFLG